MRQVITAKLKLHPDGTQFQALRATQLAYRDALNYVSRYSFEHGKESNQEWLQRETYADIRALYHLPAQMACNVPRQVGATYKTLWTKVKQNTAAWHAGISKKQRKANAAHAKWAYGELHAMIAYKALRNSSMAITVDAHFTSQACPRCGHTCPENRPEKGLLFV
ncbi:MAG TPA: zinc ribbon domain-containing protein, partial [Ktedonobacteraceae bacterium]|nr:zinc ribbon domain-containing protein [Ktedonobacteraceae bacterium]